MPSDARNILLFRAFQCLKTQLVGVLKKHKPESMHDWAEMDLQYLVQWLTDSKKHHKMFGTRENDMKDVAGILNLNIRSQLKEMLHVRNKFAHGQNVYPAEFSRCFQLTKRLLNLLQTSSSPPISTQRCTEIMGFTEVLQAVEQSGDGVVLTISQSFSVHDDEEVLRLQCFYSLPLRKAKRAFSFCCMDPMGLEKNCYESHSCKASKHFQKTALLPGH